MPRSQRDVGRRLSRPRCATGSRNVHFWQDGRGQAGRRGGAATRGIAIGEPGPRGGNCAPQLRPDHGGRRWLRVARLRRGRAVDAPLCRHRANLHRSQRHAGKRSAADRHGPGFQQLRQLCREPGADRRVSFGSRTGCQGAESGSRSRIFPERGQFVVRTLDVSRPE